MKFFIVFVIALVLGEEAFATSVIICPNAHESFHSCSSGCELTCDNYLNPPICLAACLEDRAGCYCDTGYVRSKDGRCILPSECKAVTPICPNAHESYHSCSNGCELTCDNYLDPPMCIQACLPQAAGCYCNVGYVRSKDGRCILPSQCKATTPFCLRPHEKYLSCSNGCETTCANKDNPPICTMDCSTKFAGCYCEYPYIRADNRDCVLPSQCKPTSCGCKIVEPQPVLCRGHIPYCDGLNEVYNPTGPLCPRTCATKDAMFKCSAGTQYGCFCAKGFLRNNKNKCVPECDC
ncbi:Serine protease inhibitor swm-1 [Pseudolycoriella hygida]|uniref:Serine protease inhibitor swm-1 n=1 Tax=Pseudolycoriella hygida TaxID=35572 RepID=A0A9Q0S552_9DIPT|nr:Serine protease inhibitor swm-1 [Pseudolycoriella hygida]